MSQENPLTLEIVGEGKTELGESQAEPAPPVHGVVSVLVHTLCGKPRNMLVKRKSVAFLQGKGWWQKVKFAKRQAYYNKSVGLIFVLDTEGELRRRSEELEKGRNSCLPDFPMAVGTPHPCIEAWLLCEAVALAVAMKLPKPAVLPEDPESLPAPRKDRTNNPKTVLARCAGSNNADLAAAEKSRIAAGLTDMAMLRQRCPKSFAPFADEIEARIKPLFDHS